MSDPKIKVGADLSAANAEIAKLGQTIERVTKQLSGGEVGIDVKKAKADLSEINDLAASVAGTLKGLGDAKVPDAEFGKIATVLRDAAEAGDALDKVLDAVGQSTNLSASIRGSKQIADNLERARRAQEILTRDGIKLSKEEAAAAKDKFDEWRSSGARGTSKLRNVEFDDWLGGGYKKHSIDAHESERNRKRILESLGIRAGGPMGDASDRWRGRGWGVAGGAMGGAFGSMMNGGDGFFQGLGSAGGSLIGMGIGGMTTGPVGAVVGGLVGAAASKALGAFGAALDQSLQRVMADAINLTDLRHSIDGTSIDFNVMRQTVRQATADLRLTNEEASRLARTFSDSVGRSMNEGQLGAGVKLGAGFSRSYGLDPAMGTAFFGSMRRMGQEGDTRLALKIGEAVARNGVSPQMGTVLQVLQNFTEQQTRLSFTRANADGYASFMSSMIGSPLAGSKDVGTVASAMGLADSAMRQGGAFGEASKVFTLGMYQRKLPGFNVFDLDYMNEQGAFGTIGGAFGKNSAAYRMAQLRGDKGKMRQYDRWSAKGGNESVLAMQMKSLERFHGGNTDELHKSIMGHFGVGAGQAVALYDAFKSKGGLGSLEKELKAAGVDISTLKPQQIGDLAQVANMNKGQIKTHAAKLLGDSSLNLTEKEKITLQKGSYDEQRKLVLKLTALHDTQKDDGERLDQANKTLQRMADDMTTRLTPAILGIKEGMIKLIEHFIPGMAVLDGPAGTTKIDPSKFSAGQKRIMSKIDAAAEKYAPGDVGFRNYLRGLGWQETHFRNVPGTRTWNRRLNGGRGGWDQAKGPMQIMQSRIDAEGIDMSDMGIDYAARVGYADYKRHGAAGAARKWFSGSPDIRRDRNGQPVKDVNGRNVVDYGAMVVANANGFAKVDQSASATSAVTLMNPGLGTPSPLTPPGTITPYSGMQTGSVTTKMPALDHTVTVRIVDDKTGKEVKTKVAGPLPAGTHVEIVR